MSWESRFVESARGVHHVWFDPGPYPQAPLLHLLHATGMNARLYLDLLGPLGRRFRLAASDARGHGRSRLPADPVAPPTGWHVYADDLIAMLDALGAGRTLLVGHSMGATVSALAAAEEPEQVAGLVLIEPAFIPFAMAADYESARATGTAPQSGMAAQAVRRRATWPSCEAVRAAYEGRGVFATWPPSALDAYLADGLRETADGVALACDPAWEAATFDGVSTALEQALDALTCPLALAYGALGSTVSQPDATAIASRCSVSPLYDPTAGHFLPIDRPEATRALIHALADAAGL